MRVNKVVLCLIPIIIVVISLGLLNGYRFTSLKAAYSHFEIDGNAKVISEVDFHWSKVYLFRTEKGPRTVMTIKKGPLWIAPAATHFENSLDAIKTVGWMGYIDEETGKSAFVFAVENNDPKVKYVEVGSEGDRVKREIGLNEPLTFSWDEAISFDEMEPKALSEEGEILYEYKTYISNNGSVTYTNNLKWQEANNAIENK